MSNRQPKKQPGKRSAARGRATEAYEQLAATAEILRVISTSPADMEPVFRTILSNASRLCRADVGAVFMFDGETLTNVAHQNASPAIAEYFKNSRTRPSRETTTRRCALERRTVHTADLMNDSDYAPAEFKRHERIRAMLSVPMLRDSELIGVITLWRRVAKPFTNRQIALVQTFADQAVIAIENARLLKETRDALEQQKASAEVLSVISGSISDTAPVFDKILESCQRLFAGRIVGLLLVDADGMLHSAAFHGARREEFQRRFPVPLDSRSSAWLAMAERRVVHFPDVENNEGVPLGTRQGCQMLGIKAVLHAPLLWKGRGIGSIFVGRDHAGAFTEKEIALLRTFADQATIAIENVRLFNETRDALEQQSASAEVLRAISSSIADTAPVFDKILDGCERLFSGRIVGINLVGEDGMLHMGAYHGAKREEWQRRFPTPFNENAGTWLSITERRVVHFPDVENGEGVPAGTRQGCKMLGIKSVIFAPLLWEGRGVGAIWVGRDHVSSFSEKEIVLLKTFADQAAIAIENVRLFNETRDALEQQSASAEVLRAIGTSISDTNPVFDKILDSCVRLFAGQTVGLVLTSDDGMLHAAAYHGDFADEFASSYPYPVMSECGFGRSIIERRVVHFPEAETDAGVPDITKQGCDALGIKSVIFAPMLWEGRGIGSIMVGRGQRRAFSEKEIALLKTFADQAAIAIENVRLFNEIQEKSRQLEIASRHKSEFLANMSHELRTPLNAIIGFTRIVMRRAKAQIDARQYENLEKILSSGQHLLALINSILDLSKVEAGRVEVYPVEIELTQVLESCARTIEPLVKPDAVTLVTAFDGALPRMYVDEEKLRQIVINLLSNAAKFTVQGSICLRARVSGEAVVIAVTDTGLGVAPDKLEVIFEEFAQADAGSTRIYGGTGLGLTIARRLARLMGGEITAESVIGGGSTFTLTLPRRYVTTGAQGMAAAIHTASA